MWLWTMLMACGADSIGLEEVWAGLDGSGEDTERIQSDVDSGSQDRDTAVPSAEPSEEDVQSSIELRSDDPCENPCTFRASASDDIVAARYEADGWDLGSAFTDEFALSYEFWGLGSREITVFGSDAEGVVVAQDTRWVTIEETEVEPDCLSVDSSDADSAPVQTVGTGVPVGSDTLSWQVPCACTYQAPFAGSVGTTASHEGLDYVHHDSSVAEVEVWAAAAGTVVYVRTGCPQSATFSSNQSVRECGAGWGNHIVIHHGGQTYTRYGHLENGTIRVSVGDSVGSGEALALMGNSGRSDVRHLHFELGSSATGFDPCGGSQSFDTVHNPAALGL